MTPEDKAQAVVDALRQFAIGDKVLALWTSYRPQLGCIVQIDDAKNCGIRFEGSEHITYWFGVEKLRHAD